MSAKQKRALFEKYNYSCAVCGRSFDPEQKGLEADHKIPLIRGGSSGLENWQPICILCNVGKRRSCQGCDQDCLQCSWAFPHSSGVALRIQLSEKMLDSIKIIAKQDKKNTEEIIVDAIKKYLRSHS